MRKPNKATRFVRAIIGQSSSRPGYGENAVEILAFLELKGSSIEPKALRRIEEQALQFGCLSEIASKVLEIFPVYSEKPLLCHAALHILARAGMRRAALHAIEAAAFPGHQGVAESMRPLLPGKRDLSGINQQDQK